MRNEDFRAIAQRSTRKGFESTCPFYFLFIKGDLRPPKSPRATQAISSLSGDEVDATFTSEMEDIPGKKPAQAAVLAIRKVQDTFPDMITVGRTNNNDMVVADVSVSRFHAFFQLRDDGVALADAGSRNGTTIDGDKLEPRAPATPVAPGSLISFGSTEFYLLDAGSLWDRLHRRTP